MTAVPVRPPVRTKLPAVGRCGEGAASHRRAVLRPHRLYATWQPSPFRRQLADRLLLLGVLCAVLLAFRLYPQQITDLMFTLLGGAK